MINLQGKTVLITGAAGFIGSNVAKQLLNDYKDVKVVGIDNLNDYYDVELKHSRLKEMNGNKGFRFYCDDISDKSRMFEIFDETNPDVVVNLAAQAGVRYSIDHPDDYIKSNICGFYNVLEACRNHESVKHLVYASSSSVYGANEKVPYSVEDKTDEPVSLYAATKKSNELMAHAYSKLYGIQSTGLRFFTVYGPIGRPDMAYFSFTKKLLNREKISIFNYGQCKRDFTYIDDIVEGVIRVIQAPPCKKDGAVPHRVYNIGNNNPENLMDFVRILSEELVEAGLLEKDFSIEEHSEYLPMQKGDVAITFADTTALEKDFGFKPSTDLRMGLKRFVEWYKEYYMR